jgi:hypothetical protein
VPITLTLKEAQRIRTHWLPHLKPENVGELDAQLQPVADMF